MEDLFTSSVRDAERVLESVVLSEVHLKRYTFVVDNPPIDEEHDLLRTAFELDGELYQDETFSIQELVTVTRIDLDLARRILCRWIDDAVAYVPITKLDPNIDREPIVLLEKAKRRIEDWARNRAERQRRSRFMLTINIPRPFPKDAENLIRSIGLEDHLHFSEVLAAPQGFNVQGIYPDDWTKDQISVFAQQLQERVRSAFTEVLRHEAPTAEGVAKLQPELILFLAANPVKNKPLALDEEARDIEAKIRASEHRESLRLKTRWAIRPDDLIHALNEDQPTIVHFSGHGDGAPGIVLQGDDDKPMLVDGDALQHLFATLKNKIRVVVLNACYTVEQAAAIKEVIDCVIAMNDSVGDKAARKFAASFYRALGFGSSVKNAFDQGVTAIKLEGLADANVPELHVRPSVNADVLIIVSR